MSVESTQARPGPALHVPRCSAAGQPITPETLPETAVRAPRVVSPEGQERKDAATGTDVRDLTVVSALPLPDEKEPRRDQGTPTVQTEAHSSWDCGHWLPLGSQDIRTPSGNTPGPS